MIDPELIRRCVERADGWNMDEMAIVCHRCDDFSFVDDPAQWQLDALAAQLVRQFLASYEFGEHCLTVDERGASLGTDEHLIDVCGSDLTETTLKAIDQFYEEQ